MTRKSNHFRHESLQDSKAIVRYLNALAEGFEKGTLQFRDQEGEIVLEPSGMIRFEVAASRKSGRYGLNLKLSWKQQEEESPDSGPLLINGGVEDAAESEAPSDPPPKRRSSKKKDAERKTGEKAGEKTRSGE
ncbi:MAG: amphi-Trp domain-containing protein [bacterium]